MIQLLRTALALLLLLVLSRPLLADGKVFSTSEVVPVLPDQSAVIAWRNGVQTLVIEIAFRGKGDEFAWLIPLPARPEIFESTPGTVKTIRWQLRPTVLRPLDSGTWIVGTLLLSVCLLALTWLRRAPRAWVVALCCLAILYIFIASPLLGGARSARGAEGVDGVSLLDRVRIAGRDVAVLEAQDATALAAWLRDNGFHAPPSINDVVQTYCDEGWVFVASRLLTPAAGNEPATRTIRPLGFRFPTDRPVYPMRLTGVTDTPLSVELFVFGESRAVAPDFVTTDCRLCEHFNGGQELAQHATHPHRGRVDVAHAGLIPVAAGLPVVSRLEATLTPAQMTRDVSISWAPFEHAARKVAGHDYVRSVAIRAACLAWLFVLFGVGLFVDNRRRRNMTPSIGPIAHIAAAGVCAMVVGFTTYVAGNPASTHRRSEAWTTWDARDAMNTLWHEIWAQHDQGFVPNIAWTRERLREAVAHMISQKGSSSNIDPDAVLSLGDTPGGVDVREIPGGLRLLWLDDDGEARSGDFITEVGNKSDVWQR